MLYADVGRYQHRRKPEEILHALQGPDPGHPVVVVCGVSGLGKSRLLRHMRSVLTCPVRLVDLAEVIEAQRPLGELAQHLAEGLAKALVSGQRLAWWKLWRFRRDAGLLGSRGRTSVRIVLRATRGGSVSGNDIKVDTSRRSVDREALAKALIRTARGSSSGTRVVMIDACEWLQFLDTPIAEDRHTDAGLATWFSSGLLPDLLRAAPSLRLVLATREDLPLEPSVVREVRLHAWHARETQAFLRSCGLFSQSVADAVHRSCRGIPVWVAAVADEASRKGASSDVTTAWILKRARTAPVEQWLPREFESSLPEEYRPILRAAAVLRNVQTGAVRAALGSQPLPRGWDRRLMQYSFVRRYRQVRGGARWVLHPLLRTALLAALRQEDPAGLVGCHELAAEYFAKGGDLLEESYHRFALGDGRTEERWRTRLDAACEAGQWELALRIADVALAEEVADGVAESLPSVTAAAASVAGIIAWRQQRHDRAYHLLQRAMRACGDTGDIATRGKLLIPLADTADALQLFNEAMELYVEGLRDQPDAAVAPSLARLAATAEYSGNLPLALETYQRLTHVIEHVGGPYQQGDVWNGLGRVLLDTGSAPEATQAHHTALQLNESYNALEVAAAAHCGLARVEHAAGRAAHAEEHYRKALEFATEAEDIALQAEAWNGIGYVTFDKNEFDIALQAHHTALDLSCSVSDAYGEAEAWCGIGNAFRERSSPALGEEPLEKAQELYERVGDRRGVASACCGLARVMSDLSRWTEAERAYRRALEAAESCGDLESVAEVWYGLGHVARAYGHDAEAEENYRRALDLFEEAGNPAWQCDVWNVLGHLRARTSLERAQEAYAQATGLGSEVEYLAGEILGRIGLGRIAVLSGDLGKAEVALLGVLELCDDARFVMGQLDALSSLGHLAQIRGDARAAEATYRRMLALSDGVGMEQRLRALLGLAETAGLGGDWERAAILATEVLGSVKGLENVEYLRVDTLLCLSDVALERDRFEEACARATEARTLLTSSCGDVLSEARAVLVIGLARVGMREAEEGMALLTEACELAEGAGALGVAVLARLRLATAQLDAGQVGQARASAELIDASRLHRHDDLAQFRRLRTTTRGE